MDTRNKNTRDLICSTLPGLEDQKRKKKQMWDLFLQKWENFNKQAVGQLKKRWLCMEAAMNMIDSRLPLIVPANNRLTRLAVNCSNSRTPFLSSLWHAWINTSFPFFSTKHLINSNNFPSNCCPRFFSNI